ncbi:MAG TPA: TIGR01906 family membrane protein, partial [Dehalococcoidia bacterium]|nr:TIGR01906 family membrane protein [Dehalococcoidia bacterium]
MAIAHRAASALFVVALPILLITTNVRFAGTETRLWEWGFDRYDAEGTTGIDRPELDRAADQIAAYFTNDEPYLRIKVEDDGRLQPLFNQRETAHMADVKDLFGLTFAVQAVALAYVLSYVVGVFVWEQASPLGVLARQVLLSLAVLAGAVIVIGGIALVGFDAAWEQFHIIGFDNDLWQLDPDTDHLIQMFPEDFFFDMTLLVGGLTLLEA